jgi:hypothetical protein
MQTQTHKTKGQGKPELPKWYKGEYRIATNPNCHIENQTNTRKGYIFAEVFGIDNEMRNVTHLPTGLKLPGYFSRLKDAKAYAEALFSLTDWRTVTQDNARERFTPIKTTILNLMNEYAI